MWYFKPGQFPGNDNIQIYFWRWCFSNLFKRIWLWIF